jgi:flagellar protein FlaI
MRPLTRAQLSLLIFPGEPFLLPNECPVAMPSDDADDAPRQLEGEVDGSDGDEETPALTGDVSGPEGVDDPESATDAPDGEATPELDGDVAASDQEHASEQESDADSADSADAPALDGEVSDPEPDQDSEADAGPSYSKFAVVPDYTWDDFLREHGEVEAAEELYSRFDVAPGSDRWGEEPAEDIEDQTVTKEDWDRTDVDPETYLGFPPWEMDARIAEAATYGEFITHSSPLIGYDETPVIKDIYQWADYKRQYFYDEEGEPPTDDEGEPEAFDYAEALGFHPSRIGEAMATCHQRAEEMLDLEDERTVDVDESVDEDAFFSDETGRTTVANRYDLEKTVPLSKKSHFVEEDRYWVNEPYAFVVIFRSTKENERKYYVVEPHQTAIEHDLTAYLTDKLRTSIKYDEEGTTIGDEDHRRSVIEERALDLLDRYDLYQQPDSPGGGLGNRLADAFDLDPEDAGMAGKLVRALGYEDPTHSGGQLQGIAARPEPAVLEEDADTLTEYQVEKLLYYLERDFIGYERIDPIKHDINVEDVSCDGYNSPVFVYHSDYEQIISNIVHGEKELDDFVVKLAQRSGKGISKRRPQVDATLPDGSRAQLTLGREVSDHGTNYTIRQFKDVPFTPLDLINWKTFSLDEMAFLWLCIENHKSLIFAGGTASGKTTSLNAVSLFIPSDSKIVSIEDTREVELPQRNWIASVTRPSFSEDDKGDIDEFDLLEAALRQRPDYIVMGEIRGEEGRTLFQVMSTGHTTYTTFHADNVGEVLKRFTTEPINVSKTMFTALDLVSIQTSTRVQGRKVRRNKSLTEINHYDAENDEINVQDVYQWQAETDEYLEMGESNTMDDIMFDRGWNREKLDREIFKRQVVLAYLIYNGLKTYTQVAATFQAFINDPDTIISLMANDLLKGSLEDLREMESVLIDIDPDKEAMVPRPDPSDEILAECEAILARAEEELFAKYKGDTPDSVADALAGMEADPDVTAESSDPDPVDAAGELPEGGPSPETTTGLPKNVAMADGDARDDFEEFGDVDAGDQPDALAAGDNRELEPGDRRPELDGEETPGLNGEETPAIDGEETPANDGEETPALGAGVDDARDDRPLWDDVEEDWADVVAELEARDAGQSGPSPTERFETADGPAAFDESAWPDEVADETTAKNGAESDDEEDEEMDDWGFGDLGSPDSEADE